MSYLTRSGAARAAQKKGWKSFTCFFDKKVNAWYNREVLLTNPAVEWFEETKPDFVHHVEMNLYDSILVPVLVVTCRQEEIRADEVPAGFKIEPLTRDLWQDISDSVSSSTGTRAKSEIESPVKVVWRLAEEMKGADRKAVIQACVEAGVNKSTASTQYYKWSVANKG